MRKMVIMLLACMTLFSISITTFADDSVTVPYEELKYVAGDIDCNEEINAIDLTDLTKILLGVNQAECERTEDVNEDTKINIIDLVRLKKILARQ